LAPAECAQQAERPAAARLKSGCDLVITDVVMPDENALELLPKMKKAGSADRHERAKYLHDLARLCGFYAA
jgi:DNA-binding NtrC family response regulator